MFPLVHWCKQNIYVVCKLISRTHTCTDQLEQVEVVYQTPLIKLFCQVRSKDERRPTVNELANQKYKRIVSNWKSIQFFSYGCRYVLQKINGWKIYHLAAGMEDIVDMESELSKRLQEVKKKTIRMMTIIMMGMHTARAQCTFRWWWECQIDIAEQMMTILFCRLAEGLKKQLTVRWARSWAR